MKLLLDIIQSISIIIASTTAIYGITSWRRETKWKRRYELAEEVLALFYECREKFLIIRNPAGHTDEGKTRKRSDDETPTESASLDMAYTFIERYENEKAPFIKLAALKFRFMSVFGKESGKPFEDLFRIKNKIFHAAFRLGRQYWRDQGHKRFTAEAFEKHLKEMHELEQIIWADFEETDSTTKDIEKCITNIESYCFQIMQK